MVCILSFVKILDASFRRPVRRQCSHRTTRGFKGRYWAQFPQGLDLYAK